MTEENAYCFEFMNGTGIAQSV